MSKPFTVLRNERVGRRGVKVEGIDVNHTGLGSQRRSWWK